MTRTERSPLRHRLRRPLEAAYLRERDAAPDPTPPCDSCGARVAGLIREEVEGVTCERCPTCRQKGAIP